tara:strand:- start:5435 stop:6097 length:663 start_codon:yes stop_codon:yes gene_type:complete
MLRTIHLQGELGEKFGFERQIQADSFKDVLLCLQANFEDFKTYLADCYEKEIYFIWKINDEELTAPDQLLLQYPVGDMIITPVPAGSSFVSSLLKGIVGFALITLGGGFLVAGKFIYGSLAMLAGNYLFSMGMYELLAEDPSTDANDDVSHLFSGSEQNINAEDPIPVCYGRLRIPGRPISFEIRNEDAFISSVTGNNSNRRGAQGTLSQMVRAMRPEEG